jgi:DoxX-like family
MSPKAKKILGWVFAGMLTVMAVGSSLGKFMATPESEMGAMFTMMGFYDIRFLIGSLELICAILFIIPRTSTLGVLLSAGYWGGAVATDLTHAHTPVPALAAIVLLGLAAIFRNPELFTRLLGGEVKA